METNVIYNEDCLVGMKKLPDNSVDLIITSPPYNLGDDFHSNSLRFESYKGDNMPENKYREWQVKVLNECYRILKEKGSMWYNHKIRIKNKEIKHPIHWLSKSNFIIRQEITWNQRKGANVDKCRCFPFSERIWWLTKNKDVELFNKENYKDVWNIVPKHNRKDYNHPAVMAEQVAERIYTLHEHQNINLVVDIFAGVGTTFIPAVKRNINFIGIELDKKHINTAYQRLGKFDKNYYNELHEEEKPKQTQLF